MLAETTYTQARAHLAALCDQVTNDQQPIIIKRRNAEAVAIVALAELYSLEETAHLLRSPKNAERLLTALQKAQTGKEKPQTIEELRKELNCEQTNQI